MGKLIVIEGIDGSGKSTQARELFNELFNQGRNVRLVSFPNYQSKTGELVAMYLNGDFGKDAEGVNPYAASTFYAIDRYVSFNTGWKEFYNESDSIVIASRYATSNVIHQLAKLDREEWPAFYEWLAKFEYEQLGIPKPDMVVYLDVKPEISKKLIQKRSEETGQSQDIHEKNSAYMEKCYKVGEIYSHELQWKIVKCYENDELLPFDDIKAKILEEVTLFLDTKGD